MATVILTGTQNEAAFADFVASNKGYTFDSVSREIGISVVTQAVLSAALINYAADQANIDNDFANKRADEAKDRAKDAFDDKSDLTALIKEMVDQLNELRALHALPALNFGTVNSDIRNRIE